MSDDEAHALLEECRDLQVASLDPSGFPHLVTMWFVNEPDAVVFWTYGKSQKVLNVRRDPRVSALVSSGDVYDELRGVSIRGHAEVVEDREEVLKVGERIFERYWGPITDEPVRDGVRTMGAKRVVIRIPLEHVTSWDHRKLGGAY